MQVFRISPAGKVMFAVKGELAEMVEDIETLVESGEVVIIAESLINPLESIDGVEEIDAIELSDDEED